MITAFEKRGIDYVVTCDVYEGNFEAFRAPFNRRMESEITRKLGTDIFRQITSAAQADIEKQAQRR